jgi:hypothetical protein
LTTEIYIYIEIPRKTTELLKIWIDFYSILKKNEVVEYKLEYFTHLLKFMKEPLHYNDLFKDAPFSIIPMECTDLFRKVIMNEPLSRMVRNTNFHQKVRNARSLKSKSVIYFATLLLIKRKWINKFFHHY